MWPQGPNRCTGHMRDVNSFLEGNRSRRVTVAGQLALVVAVVARGPRAIHPRRETPAELGRLHFLAPGCCSRGCKETSSRMNRNCCWSPKSYPNVSS
jgi:hypothetical protein